LRRACAGALWLIALGLFAGCGAGGPSGTEVLTVYVSLPLHGQRANEGRAVMDGVARALSEADGHAGSVRVRAVYLDDTGGAARWDPVATAGNARKAAEDTSAIAFIGDLDDGATRTSLPITNQADILQISPGSGAVDLTREVSTRLGPDLYRPSGMQTFVRLVPAQDVQSPPPCPPIAYGHEAMALLLSALERAGAGADRGALTDEVVATRGRRSPIGTYSVDANGDTRLEGAAPSCGA